MSSFLRKIVAGPRAPHPEANLDLCYVTDNIIATSGPSATYPSRAYRNPLDSLVKFLDSRHGENWAIWEFRAEGTGYPDEAVYGRIKHFPWPDHHPPPFKLVPGIVGSMREWVHGADGAESNNNGVDRTSPEVRREGTGKNVIVVHCKAGKGRSGSMAVSYLVSQEGWTKADAIQRFTERRMRPGFGSGVSIPSQLRWLGYVEKWTANGKQYLERAVEVKEVHIWGLREGVKVAVEGFVEEGRKIKTFHVFKNNERDDLGEATVVESPNPADAADAADDDAGLEKSETDGTSSDFTLKKLGQKESRKDDTPALLSVVTEVMKSQSRSLSIRRGNSKRTSKNSSRSSSTKADSHAASSSSPTDAPQTIIQSPTTLSPEQTKSPTEPSISRTGTQAASTGDAQVKTTNTIFRPTEPILLPTSDINISVERRAKASYGWAMVTSVAHVWFNAFFEGRGPERLKERQEALDRRGASTDELADGVPEGPQVSGVFEITWDELDGIKGSARKGARALDKLQVVWQVKTDLKPNVSPVPMEEYQDQALHRVPTADEVFDRDAKQKKRRESKVAEERDSFESAPEVQAPVEEGKEGVLIREPTRGGDVQESKPADWKGSPVRKAGSDQGSPMARRLGLRQEHERSMDEVVASDKVDDNGTTEKSKKKREKNAGEDQPELDENSDEDGTEGIERGVRLSVSEGSDGKEGKEGKRRKGKI